MYDELTESRSDEHTPPNPDEIIIDPIEEVTPAPQIVYVDGKGRIMGITSPEMGVEVITEYNCSMALNEDGFALYKYEGGQVLERTAEEIEADRTEAWREQNSAKTNIESGAYFSHQGRTYQATKAIPRGAIISSENSTEIDLLTALNQLNKKGE